jgi:hypothetical protein
MGLGLWGMWNQSKQANETGFVADEQDRLSDFTGKKVGNISIEHI